MWKYDNGNKMRSKTVDRLIKSMPEKVKIFMDLHADHVVRTNRLLHKKGITEKELAGKGNYTDQETSRNSPSKFHIDCY